jgi:hypothetical protein
MSEQLSPSDIQSFHDDVDRMMETHGFMIMSVAGVGSYTVGLFLVHGLEVVTTLQGQLAGKLIYDTLDIATTFDEDTLIINSSVFEVGGQRARMKLLRTTEGENQQLLNDFALSVKRRAISPVGFVLLQFPDENNLLPGEDGYNQKMGDQTVSEILKKIKQPS